MLAGCQEKDLVINLDNCFATQRNRFTLAENRGNTGIDSRHMFFQVTQFMSDQWSAMIGAHGHQLYPATRKIQHL